VYEEAGVSFLMRDMCSHYIQFVAVCCSVLQCVAVFRYSDV